MALQNWSDEIVVVELADDPQLSDELSGLMECLSEGVKDVVLDFAAVSFVNSSNLSKLLKLRKVLTTAKRHLILSRVNTQVWGVFLITGLDKIFECTNDVSTALATLQLASPKPQKKK